MKILHWSDGHLGQMACFLYWAMFLKASGLNGVDALAMVLGNRKGKLGHCEVVVGHVVVCVGLPDPSR